MRLLGVDQSEGPHPGVAGKGVPGDHPAAVVADDGQVVEAQHVDLAHRGDVFRSTPACRGRPGSTRRSAGR
ncbi:MAG: hypothetical protein R2699_19500 [Acidimicrobiales bacterium]